MPKTLTEMGFDIIFTGHRGGIDGGELMIANARTRNHIDRVGGGGGRQNQSRIGDTLE